MNKTSILMLGVFALVLAMASQFSPNRAQAKPDMEYEVAGYTQSEIVVFTTDWCPTCKDVKEILNRNNIDYVELDIESNDEIYNEYDRLGGEYIPYIIYKGQVVDEYSEKRLINALSKLGES